MRGDGKADEGGAVFDREIVLLHDLAVQCIGKALGRAHAHRFALTVGDDLFKAVVVQMRAFLINVDELAVEGGANIFEIASAFGTGSNGAMIAAAALAYLMFNLFTPPCFAAIGAMNAEMKSKKWLFAAIGLQFGVGYSVAFLVRFFGTLFTSPKNMGPVWTSVLGWAVVLAFAAILVYLVIKRRKEAESGTGASQKSASEALTV